jgi:hypothetical protein
MYFSLLKNENTLYAAVNIWINLYLLKFLRKSARTSTFQSFTGLVLVSDPYQMHLCPYTCIWHSCFHCRCSSNLLLFVPQNSAAFLSCVIQYYLHSNCFHYGSSKIASASFRILILSISYQTIMYLALTHLRRSLSRAVIFFLIFS